MTKIWTFLAFFPSIPAWVAGLLLAAIFVSVLYVGSKIINRLLGEGSAFKTTLF